MLRKLVVMAYGLTYLGLPSTSWAVSFDCAQAQNDVEREICDLPELSAADDALAKAYAAALALAPNKAEARKAQRAWLRKRNATPVTSELVTLYRERIVELNVAAGREPKSWSTIEKELRVGTAGIRVVMEKSPSPDGDYSLRIVVLDGSRELQRFPMDGNSPCDLEAGPSGGATPMVVGSSLSCGGSCSNLQITVIALPSSSPPRAVLQRSFAGGSIRVTKNKLIVEEPVYEIDDPSCCPSKKQVFTFTRQGDELTDTIVRPQK